MKKIENEIKKSITLYYNVLKKYCIGDFQKLFFYYGYEISEFHSIFGLVNNKVSNFNKEFFPKYSYEVYNQVLEKKLRKSRYKIESIVLNMDNPPTHIKVTYDIKKDSYEFEYIYDKLLDEDKGDSFGTLFREWQYQLGKPRPEEIEIPEGYHLEIRSIKKEIK
ncbi:MAG: hypothetical protein ACRCXZ_06555, partial [Patescibacteria group bacterium]